MASAYRVLVRVEVMLADSDERNLFMREFQERCDISGIEPWEYHFDY